MNDIEMKREQLKKLYPNKAWAARVIKMPESQVQAIFLRAKRDGKL